MDKDNESQNDEHTFVSCKEGETKPIPGECNAYTQCIDGIPRKQFCAPSLHWVQSKKTCDWSSNSECANEVDNDLALRMQENDDCSFSGNELEENDCSIWYQCVHNKVVRYECGAGLVFDGNKCDWPDNVDCGNRKVTAQEVPQQTSETEVESVGDDNVWHNEGQTQWDHQSQGQQQWDEQGFPIKNGNAIIVDSSNLIFN